MQRTSLSIIEALPRYICETMKAVTADFASMGQRFGDLEVIA
jgi:hypothetical protein